MTKDKRVTKSLMSKIIILLYIVILPVNIAGLLFIYRFYIQSLENIKNMISNAADSYLLLLDNSLSNTDYLFYQLSRRNSDYLYMLQSKDDDWSYRYYSYLLSMEFSEDLNISDSATGILINIEARNDFIRIPNTLDANRFLDEGFIDCFIKNYHAQYAKWNLFYKDEKPYIVKINHDTSTNVYYAFYKELESILQNLSSSSNFKTLDFRFTESPGKNSRKDCYVWNRTSKKGISLEISIAKKELRGTLSPWQYGIIFVFILYLTVSPVLFVFLRRNVEKPLKELDKAHSMIESGEKNYRITTRVKTTEFEKAFNSFNNMAEELDALEKSVIEKETANKQLMIDYLQLQIRPHFLLNTFNVLFTLIQKGEKETAQSLILYLSDYFRYIFKSGSETQKFSNELKLIKEYLEVAQVSYPSSFSVSYQIDPIIEYINIPPLVLHSFIENIIQHALLPERTVHIVLSAMYEEKKVTFYISDDGKGMSPESVRSIFEEKEASLKGKSIGIRNAVKRLKYYYGPDCRIDVESEINVGTTFTISIPYEIEEEIYESFIG